MIDPLAQLKDIHTPAAIWWPPAPLWWLLGFVLLALIGAFGLYYAKNRYKWQLKSQALKELQQIDPAAPKLLFNAYHQLLKRFAQAYFAQQDPNIATLHEKSWHAFLLAKMPPKYHTITQREAEQLTLNLYRPCQSEQLEASLNFIKLWIRKCR